MNTTVGLQQLQRVSQTISEICDQINCHFKAKPTGIELCMARICYDVAKS